MVATQFSVSKVDVPADLKTKIAAAREILKRYPGDDKLVKAQIRKAEAEADIAEIQAKTAKQGNALPELTIVDSWEQDYGGDDT
ncbi:Phage terminase small subunit [Lactiplantibacillus plantarum]|nr:Phage terminase small subunit [Lactiplantibacillus plantarum]